METKIMLCAGVFFGGWLWFYLFMRQFLFNLMTAYPMIRKMQEIDPNLIAVGAKRYTNTSIIVCTVFSAIVLFVIFRFCPHYLIISFFVGAVLCMLMLWGKLSPQNKAMFENFCAGYCRFVGDDELRTLMFNKEIKKINRRLREMGYDRSFVPEFKQDA
ncbi:MAG: hypothetical protein II873_08945 [Oscillospiraceae bacterium]|jgi:hypothetical protein|nr:hypothetical protein [Oscillospiraceae bacterium]